MKLTALFRQLLIDSRDNSKHIVVSIDQLNRPDVTCGFPMFDTCEYVTNLLKIRDHSTRKSGLQTSGFSEAFEKLALIMPNKTIMHCSAVTDEYVMIFCVYFDELNISLLGCITIVRVYNDSMRKFVDEYLT